MIGHNQELEWPAYTEKLDYELEIALVVGKAGKNISQGDAREHIYGFCCMNDFSARDIQMDEMSVRLGPAKGKDFATSIGPWIVTLDEVGDFHSLEMYARVNGGSVVPGNCREMFHSWERMIEHVSWEETIYPSDVMGSGHSQPRLRAGDRPVAPTGRHYRYRDREPGDPDQQDSTAVGPHYLASPLALLFPALTGAVNILDKLIIDRSRPQHLRLCCVDRRPGAGHRRGQLICRRGTPRHLLVFVGWGAVIGAVSATGLMFLLAALKYGHVNRVVPVWFTYPLLVAPIAAVFLDERLFRRRPWSYLPCCGRGNNGLVGGDSPSGRFGHPAALLLALGASAGWALSFVLSRHFLGDGSFWQVFASYRLGFAAVMLMGIGSHRVRTSAVRLVRDATFVKLMIIAELIITVVVITRFAAVSLGPDVSIIAAISAVQPALVFFYSLVLAEVSPLMFGSWVNRGTFFTQAGGIFAITAAVVIISLRGSAG